MRQKTNIFRSNRNKKIKLRQCGLQPSKNVRLGSVLLLVVVVIAMITLAAYNFARLMTTELEATVMYTNDVQARATADSGVEYAATLIGTPPMGGHDYQVAGQAQQNWIHNPALFMGVVVSPSAHARANSRFSIIAPVEHDTKNNAIRYGLMDESAKLNLNYLPNSGLINTDIQTMMMNIPNMTADIIDSILDWMDSDDTPNPYGAETDTYQQMKPPYKAKNGPFESIDELLLVKGITPTLLYGEDENRNGLLDPNENDGDASPPLDNANGVLDHGFVAYLSIYGRESNRRSDGKLKINVNNGYLTELYDELSEAFDKDTANFIIAYRINGPYYAPPAKAQVSLTNPVPAADPNAPPSDPNAVTPISTLAAQFAQGILDFSNAVTEGTVGETTRNEIDLSGGGATTITSLWQLVGIQAQARVANQLTTFDSPWPDEPSSLITTIPEMFDKLTVTKDEFLEGRININQARREVLMALVGTPTMTEQIVEGIVGAQRLDANGQPQLETIRQHTSTAWLYAEGLVDLPGMVNLDPWITAHGDVYRAQVLGFCDGGGPVARVEAMIDGTQRPPRVILQRDLNELGRGYSRSQLLQVQIQR